jgi:hypothetical protein
MKERKQELKLKNKRKEEMMTMKMRVVKLETVTKIKRESITLQCKRAEG